MCREAGALLGAEMSWPSNQSGSRPLYSAPTSPPHCPADVCIMVSVQLFNTAMCKKSKLAKKKKSLGATFGLFQQAGEQQPCGHLEVIHPCLLLRATAFSGLPAQPWEQPHRRHLPATRSRFCFFFFLKKAFKPNRITLLTVGKGLATPTGCSGTGNRETGGIQAVMEARRCHQLCMPSH